MLFSLDKVLLKGVRHLIFIIDYFVKLKFSPILIVPVKCDFPLESGILILG
jgi:hypothetical protein